jgi:hypothetical protein
MKSLQDRVAQEISGASPIIQDKVVAHFAGKEISRRADLIVSAMDNWKELNVQVKKIRCDQQSFDTTGQLVSETFSKQKMDERNSLTRKIADLTAAVEDALTNNNYDKLEKLVGKS